MGDARMDGWVMRGWMDRDARMDGCEDGWMGDARMDGWVMRGWMDR